MTNPTIDHPVWGPIEVLQDGGSWILCQVGQDSKKVSKAWLRERDIPFEHAFEEPEPPVRKPRLTKEDDEEDHTSEAPANNDDWDEEEHAPVEDKAPEDLES